MALKEGAEVTINARDGGKLSQLVSTLSRYGKIHSVKGDLSTPQNAKEVINTAVREMGGLDGLVITVGGYVEDSVENPSGLEEMLTNHVKVPIYVVGAALPHLKGGASVVMVSSMAAINVADPSQLSYASAKASMVKLVEVLASELLDRGVRVNGIAPTSIRGDFEPDQDWTSTRKLGDDSAPPGDFARVAIWLLTSESEWVDGVVIPADGGARLKRRGG